MWAALLSTELEGPPHPWVMCLLCDRQHHRHSCQQRPVAERQRTTPSPAQKPDRPEINIKDSENYPQIRWGLWQFEKKKKWVQNDKFNWIRTVAHDHYHNSLKLAYFTWIFPFPFALYFHSSTSVQRQRLYFVLHYVHLKLLVTLQIKCCHVFYWQEKKETDSNDEKLNANQPGQ